ncbi:hypothetical protein BV898_19669 [Hypsibius exemplaris]|uniref:Uncharacterized protein n=1 Tax=Hypsibius exemplaris TaxID=2072580 RepID=A0A9X6NRE0_HYPEX|nr:hypothetical protein BV898_19669 [Hypsibius exemplaris]
MDQVLEDNGCWLLLGSYRKVKILGEAISMVFVLRLGSILKEWLDLNCVSPIIFFGFSWRRLVRTFGVQFPPFRYPRYVFLVPLDLALHLDDSRASCEGSLWQSAIAYGFCGPFSCGTYAGFCVSSISDGLVQFRFHDVWLRSHPLTVSSVHLDDGPGGVERGGKFLDEASFVMRVASRLALSPCIL